MEQQQPTTTDNETTTTTPTNNSKKRRASRHRRSVVVIGAVALLVFLSILISQPRAVQVLTINNRNNNITTYFDHHHDNKNNNNVILQVVPLTIVCQLSGEMGNNLGKLGHCLSLKWRLESGEFYNSTYKLGYDVRIALRHDNVNYWERAANDLKKCFPNIANTFSDFSEMNNVEFEHIFNMQNDLFGMESRWRWRPRPDSPFDGINLHDGAKVDALHSFVEHVAMQHSTIIASSSPTTTMRKKLNASTSLLLAAHKQKISIPFLYADSIQTIHGIAAEQFHDKLRQFFRFNYESSSCCKIQADPDESVFHFRNFHQEMKGGAAESMGFLEANPKQAAEYLFGHLNKGDKVVIVTRIDDRIDDTSSAAAVQEYVDEFEKNRGLKVRVINGQTGTQDFCLIMSAQKEVVGLSYSTYSLWASYLGNATKVIVYSMAGTSMGRLDNYNFTNQVLRDKFEYRTIPSEGDADGSGNKK